MASQPAAPRDPVSVIRTARALYLHVSPDWSVIVAVQPAAAVGRLEDPPLPLVDSPVFAREPVFLLVRMTVDGPGAEHRIEHVAKALEDFRADDVRLVIRPTDNHGIQRPNERLLIHMLMAVDRLAELFDMPVDSPFAGLDARFEAMQASSAVLPRLGSPDWVLSDVKAEEVEPRFALWHGQGMGDPRLAWLPFESPLFQPRCGHLLASLDDLELLVQDHEVG